MIYIVLSRKKTDTDMCEVARVTSAYKATAAVYEADQLWIDINLRKGVTELGGTCLSL